jgi:cytochrome c oxidase cbb3-type subunit IV
MDMNVFHGVLTAVLMALFVGLVVWAYGRGRRDEFSAAARMPLEEPRGETREREG